MKRGKRKVVIYLKGMQRADWNDKAQSCKEKIQKKKITWW
jgi:hypothetical protein